MSKLNSSPERNQFAIKNASKRADEKGEDPNDNYYIQFLKSDIERRRELEQDPKWQENNLEYDLRSAKWICDKVKADNNYAQNLYAAMCNNEFLKLDIWPILTEKHWSCSWRYAGGIIADMQEKGDYIDWYCSGIRGGYSDFDSENFEDPYLNYVSEGVITEEIRSDLLKLGWTVITNE